MMGLVSQSNFVPWRGYFASARKADRCIFYDSQQFTRRDWRNRNLILANHQPIWLTLPVNTAGSYLSPINEIHLSEVNSFSKILDKLKYTYARNMHQEGFKFVTSIFEECYQFTLLSEANWFTTKAIAKYLEIGCEFDSDIGIELHGGKNEKLIEVCKHFAISRYLSGPAAIDYLDVSKFEASNISVEFLDYKKLPKIEVAKDPSIIHWLLTETKDRCIELTTFEN
jgi:hypothetical protein